MDVSDMQGVPSARPTSHHLPGKWGGGGITASCYIKVGMIILI